MYCQIPYQVFYVVKIHNVDQRNSLASSGNNMIFLVAKMFLNRNNIHEINLREKYVIWVKNVQLLLCVEES
jgi:hypothetical protein